MKENSIEAYVKILEKFSNENVIYGSTVGMTLEKYKDLQLSTEHILSDYKRVLKENEKYKKAIDVVNKEKADWIRAYQEEKDKQFGFINKMSSNNLILKQEIKNKIINEIKKSLK